MHVCSFKSFVDGRKLCTGSRDNWMCLWDIESAKCEHRHNISRNLVGAFISAFVPKHEPVKKHQPLHFFSSYFYRAISVRWKLFCVFVSFQVTHVCWVPASFSVVQTSEDKTIRYNKNFLFRCIFLDVVVQI